MLILATAGLAMASGLFAPGQAVLAAAVPEFSLNIPHNTIDFGTVTPAFAAQNLNCTYNDCRVRSSVNGTRCEIFAAPYEATDSVFYDPVEEVSFPVSQLQAWDAVGRRWNPMEYGNPKRLARVTCRGWTGFTFRFRLSLTGNEAAGSYAATILITAVAYP